ncbi:hypothetical protein [Polaromonas sp.]|uniref:hypothetical protein n=1 Tax=Polaromonas sp. TaxID=1869339 RepID=UPI002BE9D31C|nr:hypothetical protein [Polaromonas sp.]HQS00795.1 hypothetical protein [Polaromonas sp.]HQS38976.1 hypothetical protein [Polaromonas sp.]
MIDGDGRTRFADATRRRDLAGLGQAARAGRLEVDARRRVELHAFEHAGRFGRLGNGHDVRAAHAHRVAHHDGQDFIDARGGLPVKYPGELFQLWSVKLAGKLFEGHSITP